MKKVFVLFNLEHGLYLTNESQGFMLTPSWVECIVFTSEIEAEYCLTQDGEDLKEKNWNNWAIRNYYTL